VGTATRTPGDAGPASGWDDLLILTDVDVDVIVLLKTLRRHIVDHDQSVVLSFNVDRFWPLHITRRLDRFYRTHFMPPLTFQVQLQPYSVGAMVRPYASMETNSVCPNPLV
jgi:hypothetical protein